MPFTLAHPAAVLPLRRYAPGAFVALLVGSMVPDTPYFLPSRLGGWGWLTHSLRGSLLVDVPLGCVLVLLLCVLRRPLTVLLGARAREIVAGALEDLAAAPRPWLQVAPAVLLGAWTHIGWDSFTHSTGWMVRRLAALRAPVSIGPWSTELCHVLQYLSSILGLWVIALVWRGTLKRHGAVEGGSHAPRAVLAAVLLAALVAGSLQVQQGWHGGSTYHLIMLLTTRSIAWFALLYLLAGTLVLASRRAVPACES